MVQAGPGRLQLVALLLIFTGVALFLHSAVELVQDAAFWARASSAKGVVGRVRNEGAGSFVCVIEFRGESSRVFAFEQPRAGLGRGDPAGR